MPHVPCAHAGRTGPFEERGTGESRTACPHMRRARLPYREDGLKLTHGREAFRANDFYNGLGDWELQYTQTYGKARTPITEGDEVETASRLYRKYLQLAGEYYGEETGADKLVETYNFENLGEKR